MGNLFNPEFDQSSDRVGFRWRRAAVGRQSGAERLGASLFELPPGQAAFPLHFHLANEELLVVMSGSPTLRTPAGERQLVEGEVVSFPRGESGAHQIVNRGEAAVRFLMVSEMNAPDVVVRPESGKLSALGRPPGERGDGMHEVFYLRDSVPFWEGESGPEPE